MGENDRFEAAVVGAGPAGIACALGLAQGGVKTVLVAGPHRPMGRSEDQRTAALFGCSIDLLKNLGVFDVCRDACAPLRGIRIIDDTERLLRAPEVLFRSEEIGCTEFGFNVPQGDLVAALRQRTEACAEFLTVVETKGVTGLELGGATAVLTLSEGRSVSADVVGAADGRNSICREAAGIAVERQALAQSALATTFYHEREHGEISTEFHRRHGPFTLVPMPGRRSSLVWVEKPEIAERLSKMDVERFRKALETRLQGLLGDVGEIGPRVVFPLSSVVAKSMARSRVALIGEAGHVVPPIGAQGLNISLRDGATLADLVVDAKASGNDLGGDGVMSAYNSARWFDVHSRVRAVDVLNWSLISAIEPVQLMRGAGIHALKAIGPLRRFVVSQGMGPQTGLPRMMRKDVNVGGGARDGASGLG